GVAPLGVALPALDQRIGDRLAFSVENASEDAQRPRRLRGDHERPGGPGQREAEERPDGLRRRHPYARPPTTVAKWKASATAGTVADRSSSAMRLARAPSSRREL